MVSLSGWRSSRSRLTHFRFILKFETCHGTAPRFLQPQTTFSLSRAFTQTRRSAIQSIMSDTKKEWTALGVRETFLKYFEGKEHTIGTFLTLSHCVELYFGQRSPAFDCFFLRIISSWWGSQSLCWRIFWELILDFVNSPALFSIQRLSDATIAHVQ